MGEDNILTLPTSLTRNHAVGNAPRVEITQERYAQLVAIESAAMVFVADVETRKRAGWHKVPMKSFTPLQQLLSD